MPLYNNGMNIQFISLFHYMSNKISISSWQKNVMLDYILAHDMHDSTKWFDYGSSWIPVNVFSSWITIVLVFH